MKVKQKKRKHLTEEQKEIMVSFMETHGDISTAATSTTSTREKKQKLVNELVNALNACTNGVVRTPKEWLKSWSHNKNKTKCKAAAISKQRLNTDGGPHFGIPPLTSWEERIMGLISTEGNQKSNIVEATTQYEASGSKQLQPIEFIEVDNISNASSETQELETIENISESDKQKKRKHLTEKQKEILISFMETHGDISTAVFTFLVGKERKQKLVEELTNALNTCKNGVVRTPREWMKSWSDNKNKTKSKAAAISRQQQGTGSEVPPLTSWEERIMALKTPEVIKGQDNIEAAFSDTTQSEVKITEQLQPTEFIKLDNISTASSLSIKAEPSVSISDCDMTDHIYSLMPETSRETTPTPTTSHVSTERRNRKKRRRRARNSDDEFENFMRDFIAVQKETNSAILELASSVKEGCRIIAESCNNIARAYCDNK